MTLSEVHGRLRLAAQLYFSILTVWGYIRFFRKQGVAPNYWGALAIGEVLLFIQSALGAYLWLTGLQPARGWVHELYGVVSLLSLPAAYAFTRGRDERPEMLIYSSANFFNALIIWRAWSTAFGQ